MPAVLAVLWVPLSTLDTFPHPKTFFFCRRWKIFGSNEEKIALRGFFFFPTISPHRCSHQPSCLHCKQAKTSCPGCRSLLWPCNPCVCVQMTAAVVCLPQTVCRGCDIGCCMCQIWAAGPGRRRDCISDGYRSSLTVSDKTAILTVCGRTVCLRSLSCCHLS